MLEEHNLPLMKREAGYLQSTYWLSCHPSLIGEVDSSNTTNRHRMIIVNERSVADNINR